MAAGKDARKAEASRATKETEISVAVDLDGAGRSDIATGIGFFDHMLEQLSRHSLIDMTVKAKGDLHIDDHHTVEDTGIVLGQAIAKALGERRGIARYASIDLAMDETLTKAAVDVSGRPYLVWNVEFSSPVAARLLGGDGVVRGKQALREYWTLGLEKIPDLRFELIGVYQGVGLIVINYRNQAGGLVNEVLILQDGLVVRGYGTYPVGTQEPGSTR